MITMFTGNDCGKCKAAKEHINNIPAEFKEGIELVEINVDAEPGQRRVLQEVYKSNTLPTFLLQGHNEPLRGFDENIGKIQDYIGI